MGLSPWASNGSGRYRFERKSSASAIRVERDEPIKGRIQFIDQPGCLCDRATLVELTKQLATEKAGAGVRAINRPEGAAPRASEQTSRLLASRPLEVTGARTGEHQSHQLMIGKGRLRRC